MVIEIGLLAIAFTLLLNIIGVTFWAGNMNSRVRSLETQVQALSQIPERLARVEAVVQNVAQATQQTQKDVSTVKDLFMMDEHRRLKQGLITDVNSTG